MFTPKQGPFVGSPRVAVSGWVLSFYHKSDYPLFPRGSGDGPRQGASSFHVLLCIENASNSPFSLPGDPIISMLGMPMGIKSRR